MRWVELLRRAIRPGDQEEEKTDVGTYDGGQGSPDSSSWKRDVATHRNGEPVPAPAPMERGDDGLMKRAVTPDPYLDPDAPTLKNFGRS